RLLDLPSHPSIAVGVVTVDAPDEQPAGDDASPLLRVTRPKLTPPPQAPPLLRDFVLPGWEHPDGTVSVRSTRNVIRDGQTITEAFADDELRVSALDRWRDTWMA